MIKNVEDGKTLLSQPSAIGTTGPMPPTGESIILFSCTSVMSYSDLNPPSSCGKHDNVPNKSPSLDEVVTDMKNNMKEEHDRFYGPNFKPPKFPKSPRIDESRNPIKLEYTKNQTNTMPKQKECDSELHQEEHVATAHKST